MVETDSDGASDIDDEFGLPPNPEAALAALKWTRDSLEKKLANNPDFQNWRGTQAAIASLQYAMAARALQRTRKQQYLDLVPPDERRKLALRLMHRHGWRERIVMLSADYISLVGRPVAANELLEHLVSKGAEFRGSDPLQNIRSVLSRDPKFRFVRLPNRTRGYGLADVVYEGEPTASLLDPLSVASVASVASTESAQAKASEFPGAGRPRPEPSSGTKNDPSVRAEPDEGETNPSTTRGTS